MTSFSYCSPPTVASLSFGLIHACLKLEELNEKTIGGGSLLCLQYSINIIVGHRSPTGRRWTFQTRLYSYMNCIISRNYHSLTSFISSHNLPFITFIDEKFSVLYSLYLPSDYFPLCCILSFDLLLSSYLNKARKSA